MFNLWILSMRMMMRLDMISVGVSNLSGLVGVGQRHVDGGRNLSTVVGGQVEEVVGSGHHLAVDLVDREAGVVGTQLAVDGSDVVVHEVRVFLSHVFSGVSAWH